MTRDSSREFAALALAGLAWLWLIIGLAWLWLIVGFAAWAHHQLLNKCGLAGPRQAVEANACRLGLTVPAVAGDVTGTGVSAGKLGARLRLIILMFISSAFRACRYRDLCNY